MNPCSSSIETKASPRKDSRPISKNVPTNMNEEIVVTLGGKEERVVLAEKTE